jgi:hypothetical protein
MSAMTAYYKEKLEQGLTYQDFVVEQLYNIGLPIISYGSKKYQHLIGENKCGFEIKFDDKLKTTGNLYIEIAEKSNPANRVFVPSGIYRSDNTWLYIIGDYSIIFIFSKKRLRKIYERKQYIKFGGREVGIATSKGFVMPAKCAEEELAVKVINVKMNDKGQTIERLV